MQCSQCKSDVLITTPHQQALFGVSGLCPECRDRVFEESYMTQDKLPCCRNCISSDWCEDYGIMCCFNHKPVSAVGICGRFEVAG